MTYGGNPFDGPVGGDPFHAAPGAPPTAPPPGVGSMPEEANTLATLSVVFAFVFAPAGAILGHLAIGQIARSGQRGRDRALAGITLSYFFITAATVSLVVWSTIGPEDSITASTSTPPSAPMTTSSAPPTTEATPSPPPPPPVPTVDPTALPSLLLGVGELQSLLGQPGLEPVWSSEAIGLQPERGGIVDSSCAGAFFKGTPTAYAGNEPLRFLGTDIGVQTTGLLIGQGAAVYPDAPAAQRALTAYLDDWRACTGKTTQTIPADTRRTALTLVFGAPLELGNGMTRVDTDVSPTASGGTWAHVITVRSNVLVDNIFIGVDLGDTPVRVTQAMIDRIPG